MEQRFSAKSAAWTSKASLRNTSVAKYKYAPYGLENSWVKIKNPSYSQIIGHDELFKKRSA